MPTKTQRLKTIADALINGTATTAQINKLGTAIAARMGRLDEYNAADAAGKAGIAIEEIRRHLVGLVREYEINVAAKTASSSADTEFQEIAP